TNDVDTIGQTLQNSLTSLVSAVTMFIGSVVMMLSTNWIMALTAIVSSMLGFGLMQGIMNRSQKYFVARQRWLGDL
ncbi:MAG TPA: ABC transporter, partial [Clostridiales bacterium]|nr:ABC transporter [Clostridiales bacterium]